MATPPGQVHEIGALMVAVSAAAEGWGVTYLGPDLPVAELLSAVGQAGARAVALSVVYSPTTRELLAALRDDSGRAARAGCRCWSEAPRRPRSVPRRKPRRAWSWTRCPSSGRCSDRLAAEDGGVSREEGDTSGHRRQRLRRRTGPPGARGGRAAAPLHGSAAGVSPLQGGSRHRSGRGRRAGSGLARAGARAACTPRTI